MVSSRFAIVVGHEEHAPGAKGVAPLNVYEYEYNKAFAGLLAAELMDLRIVSEIFFRDKVGIAGAYHEVNIYSPAAVVELHFNASGNGQAQGTETLFYPKMNKSIRFAYLMQTFMCQALERDAKQDRGWKICDKTDRGHFNLIQANCPSILTEPFFGDNPVDAFLGFTKKNDLAASMAQAIQMFIQEVKTDH